MEPATLFLPKLEDVRLESIASPVWRTRDSAGIFLVEQLYSFFQKPSVAHNAALLGCPRGQLPVSRSPAEVIVGLSGGNLDHSSFHPNLSA
jgi:hypothetical protein